MKTNVKEQHPVRIYRDTWEKLKVKTDTDGLSFQKLTEILLQAYLKGNKEVTRLVTSFAEKKGLRKNRSSLDEMEADELLRLIEEEYSPLRLIEEVDEEFRDEE